MFGSTNIVAFVPTKDATKARAFYEGVLGLRFVKQDGFATVLDANGIKVRVAKVPQFTPAQFTILGWEVADIRKTADSLKEKGVPARDSDSSSKTNSGSGPRQPATRWRGSKILMEIYFPSPSMSRKPTLVRRSHSQACIRDSHLTVTFT
jgi:catechol 2,3-dioxygenase-like lactoylglutathione lyase family enzyme